MNRIIAYLVMVMLAAHTTVRADDDVVEIAVRADVQPFVWQDKNSEDYLGFFWDVCTEAVQRADFKFNVTQINACERKAFFDSGQLRKQACKTLELGDGGISGSDRTNDETSGIDLLCDPTTITLARMRTFVEAGDLGLAFSPIVFVANGTYVVRNKAHRSDKLPRAAPETCGDLLALILDEEPAKPQDGSTNSASTNGASRTETKGWRSWLRDMPTFTLRPAEPTNQREVTYEVWGYVVGSTTGEAVEKWLAKRRGQSSPPDDNLICTLQYASHEKAAEHFCAGKLDRFIGDADILRATLDEQTSCVTSSTPPKSVRTYEPYAFVVSRRRVPDLPERLTLALYGMFEDGTMERLFAGHFSETQMSPHLSTLFRINSIP